VSPLLLEILAFQATRDLLSRGNLVLLTFVPIRTLRRAHLISLDHAFRDFPENLIAPITHSEVRGCADEADIVRRVAILRVLAINAWGKWTLHE
jgi:hypothetical protein